MMMAVPCWSSWNTGMSSIWISGSFDFETGRCGDVFQVDAAKGRRDAPHGVDEFLRPGSALTSMSNTSISAKALNSTALPSITGLLGGGADVAETEHRGAVGDHGDQVALGGVLIGHAMVARNFQTGFGDPRCIGQRKVMLGDTGFGDPGADFTRVLTGVVFKRLLFVS